MRIRQSILIVIMTIAAAVVYGIVHDEITARICVEYFTIGHPPVFGTQNPTLLGLGWGIIATWWVGLILGILLAAAARLGQMPRKHVIDLFRPLLITLGCVGVVAGVAGIFGHIAALHGWVYLVGPMAEQVPVNHQVEFLTDLWTHLASYIGGAIGGLVMCAWVIAKRRREVSSTAGGQGL